MLVAKGESKNHVGWVLIAISKTMLQNVGLVNTELLLTTPNFLPGIEYKISTKFSKMPLLIKITSQKNHFFFT